MTGRCGKTLNPARRSSVRLLAAAMASCRSLSSKARRLVRPILDAGTRSMTGSLAVWSQRMQLKSNQMSTSFLFALTRNLYVQRKHRRPLHREQNLNTLTASEGGGETDQTKSYLEGFRSIATGSPRAGGRPRRDLAGRGRPQIHCCLWAQGHAAGCRSEISTTRGCSAVEPFSARSPDHRWHGVTSSLWAQAAVLRLGEGS